ncbi:hypothetical protein LCGC14_1113690 [marine sediment metagenome]|uniref:Uncharacterized protein n=1 Tax=marine sediment metagenome TaxID=412755 RepID=A0A0F9M620_9ZZZZ
MRWGDVGGKSRFQHVVVIETSDGYIQVLCGQGFVYGYHVERRKPLPRCRKCSTALRKEVEKLTSMLAAPTEGDET